MQNAKNIFQPLDSAGRWAAAVLFSLILNAVLLSVLPMLFESEPVQSQRVDSITKIDVVRVKRKEIPPVKKEEKKPEEQKKPLRVVAAAMVRQKPPPMKLTLPFEINPKLPAGAGTLPIIPMETGPLDLPGPRDAYGVHELDSPLTPTAQVPPVYPLHARRRGIEGWVKVKFLVTDHGFVDRIEIVDAAPKRIFDDSVTRCISSWRFKPGTVHGDPVNTWVTTTIHFKLET